MAEGAPAKGGWNRQRERYACRDLVYIDIIRKTANIRDIDETGEVPNNSVRYTRDKQTQVPVPRIEVSGVEYTRDMETILGGSDGIRTIIFPNMVRTVRQGSFREVKSLRTVMLNEGLEALGTSEYVSDDKTYCGVFEKSGLESVKFPSTLRRIKCTTFFNCKKLKSVNFSDKLEYVGVFCFLGTGLENVKFPTSLRIIDNRAFESCKSLTSVVLPQKLERIGNLCFSESGLKQIHLPSTLREIESSTFY